MLLMVFVQEMHRRGLDASYKLDLLKDEIPVKQDMILADAVLHHFVYDEMIFILEKIRDALTENGILVFSVKQGSGEEWVKDKLQAPRFFSYWSQDELKGVLHKTGFRLLYLSSDKTGRNNSEWLSVIAAPLRDDKISIV